MDDNEHFQELIAHIDDFANRFPEKSSAETS
jgi:hypothetical protein